MRGLVPHEWRHVGVAQTERAKRAGEGADRDPVDDGFAGTVRDSRRGMTVVELMVVMTIIAMIMGIGAYSLTMVSNTDLRSDASRLAAAIKYTYSNAAINNTEYRLVFDMDTGQYRTEIAKEPVVDQTTTTAPGDTDDFLTEEAQRLADKVEEESDLFDDDEENPFGMNRKVTYQRVQDGVLKKMKLSEGNRFARFLKAGVEEEFTEGEVSLTFFPNGFQEQVMIVLRAGDDPDDAAYTLITEPLTGSVKTFSDEIDVPDDFGAVEDDD